MLLLLALANALAIAAPVVVLPPGETPAAWEVAAGLTGFEVRAPPGPADVTVLIVGGRWFVVIEGLPDNVPVPTPYTPEAREDLLRLARSLLRPMASAPARPPPPPTPGAPTPISAAPAISGAAAPSRSPRPSTHSITTPPPAPPSTPPAPPTPRPPPLTPTPPPPTPPSNTETLTTSPPPIAPSPAPPEPLPAPAAPPPPPGEPPPARAEPPPPAEAPPARAAAPPADLDARAPKPWLALTGGLHARASLAPGAGLALSGGAAVGPVGIGVELAASPAQALTDIEDASLRAVDLRVGAWWRPARTVAPIVGLLGGASRRTWLYEAEPYAATWVPTASLEAGCAITPWPALGFALGFALVARVDADLAGTRLAEGDAPAEALSPWQGGLALSTILRLP